MYALWGSCFLPREASSVVQWQQCVEGSDKHIAPRILGQTCKHVEDTSHLNQWQSFHHLLWVLDKTELSEKINKMQSWGGWGVWKAWSGDSCSGGMLQMTITTRELVLPPQRLGSAQGGWEGRKEPEGAEGKLREPMLRLIKQRGQTS